MVGWSAAYAALADYITHNPGIEINPGIVSIPEQYRVKFYELFDAARAAFIFENFPVQITNAQSVSQKHSQVVRELTTRLGLTGVASPAPVRKFLHDPVGELARGLFDPLFQVLKSKLSLQNFEADTVEQLRVKIYSLYSFAYEELIALSLINLLEPSGIFQVEVEDSVKLDKDELGTTVFSLRYAVTELRKAEQLSFDHDIHPSLTTPDTIFFSNRIKRFVSVRVDFLQSMWAATRSATDREWLPIDRQAVLPRCILVYTADRPQDLTLVADAEKIDRPEVVVECWTDSSADMAQELMGNYTYLHPRQGTFLVSVTTLPVPIAAFFTPPVVTPAIVPEHLAANSEKGINNTTTAPENGKICLLDVGFQPSKLTPIVEALEKNPENNTSEEAICPPSQNISST
jgi:hypothetical protein